MSRMQREKGKAFERTIASWLRSCADWGTLGGAHSFVVRRASQAERADNPDVFTEGHPVLDRIWLECHDARNPKPELKLVQAERDVDAWESKRNHIGFRRPVVVWHKLRQQKTFATMRLSTLQWLTWGAPFTTSTATSEADKNLLHVVTLEFGAFTGLVSDAARKLVREAQRCNAEAAAPQAFTGSVDELERLLSETDTGGTP